MDIFGIHKIKEMDYYCACSNHDIRQLPACFCHSRNNLKSSATSSSPPPPLSPRRKLRHCCNQPRGRQSSERKYSAMVGNQMCNCCCANKVNSEALYTCDSNRASQIPRKWTQGKMRSRDDFPSPLYRCIQSCMRKELEYHNSRRRNPRNCFYSDTSLEYENDGDDDDDMHQYSCPYCVEGYDDDFDELDVYDSVTDTICLCNTRGGHQNERDDERVPKYFREASTKDEPCACNLPLTDFQGHHNSKASGFQESSTQSIHSSFQVDQPHDKKHNKLISKTKNRHEERKIIELDQKNISHRQVRPSLRSPVLNRAGQDNSMMNQLYRHLAGEHDQKSSVFKQMSSHESKQSQLKDVRQGPFMPKSCLKGTCPFLNKCSVDYRERENGRKVCTVKTCRFQEPCTKKSCAYCKELLRKLAEHEEDEHGGPDSGSADSTDGKGGADRKGGANDKGGADGKDVADGKSGVDDREGQERRSGRRGKDDRNGSASGSYYIAPNDQSIGTDSSTSSNTTVIGMTDSDSEASAPNRTSTISNEDGEFCVKLMKKCYNLNCNKDRTQEAPPNPDHLGGNQTIFPVTETIEVAEVPAVKEHLELKEFSFRPSPRSKNILGPQKERIPRFYFPPSASIDAADSTATPSEGPSNIITTNYVANVTTDPNPSNLSQGECSNNTLNGALVTPSKSVESNDPVKNCSSMRIFNALEPVQEGSVEGSITSSSTPNSKKSAPTQISTNNAYGTMTYNVGIQYPSSQQVETSGKSIETNKFNKMELRRYEQGFGWPIYKTFPSKTRKLLVHSYPLAQRKVSPARRSASPKKHQ